MPDRERTLPDIDFGIVDRFFESVASLTTEESRQDPTLAKLIGSLASDAVERWVLYAASFGLVEEIRPFQSPPRKPDWQAALSDLLDAPPPAAGLRIIKSEQDEESVVRPSALPEEIASPDTHAESHGRFWAMHTRAWKPRASQDFDREDAALRLGSMKGYQSVIDRVERAHISIRMGSGRLRGGLDGDGRSKWEDRVREQIDALRNPVDQYDRPLDFSLPGDDLFTEHKWDAAVWGEADRWVEMLWWRTRQSLRDPDFVICKDGGVLLRVATGLAVRLDIYEAGDSAAAASAYVEARIRDRGERIMYKRHDAMIDIPASVLSESRTLGFWLPRRTVFRGAGCSVEVQPVSSPLLS